jgi:hypothetical protein
MFDSAEGQPWIGCRHAIDEDTARLDISSQGAASFNVTSPQVTA